jgi:hypothetical protein
LKTFHREKLATSKLDIESMLPEQWHETGDTQFPMEPNWALYETMERIGSAVLLMAREDEQAIGYASGFVHPHSNSRRVLIGTVPTWFVRDMPGRIFVQKALLHEMHGALTMMGARRVLIETKFDKSAGRLLEAMGGKPSKVTFEFEPLTAREAVHA